MESQHVVDEVVSFSKGETEEFREVIVKVGPGGGRTQRFAGRLLGESTQFNRVGVELVRVYLGRKGKYAVHKKTTDWTDLSVMTDWVKELKKKDWRSGFDLDEQSWGDSTLEVVDSFEELRDRIPAKIFRTLVDTTEHPPIEDLDI
ncbi:EXLDI protein [Nocardia sp. NPDC046473]|uniref:EXLDI protein n=1 Tax=Nocardia sp. NPDC046473 TaxID=3155733 RepID=UPI0033D5BF92